MSIVVAVDNPNYRSMGSLLLNKNGTVLVAAPTASGDLTIPNTCHQHRELRIQ